MKEKERIRRSEKIVVARMKKSVEILVGLEVGVVVLVVVGGGGWWWCIFLGFTDRFLN